MPVTAIINLRSLTGGLVPRSFHALFHPVFLNRITAGNATVGHGLHDSGGMAPFSISPVMGKKMREKIVENETYRIRIAILNNELEEVFLETIARGFWDAPFDLSGLFFQVEDIVLGEEENNIWSGRLDYEELPSEACRSDKMTLHLVSPTAFKRGDLHYPLPEPALVFANLARRWNLFSPVKLQEKQDYSDLSYANLDIHTEPYALRKSGTVIGSVGKLTFIMKGSEIDRCYYRTLLRFAFYSGIGVKTTQGMGMCRVIEKLT